MSGEKTEKATAKKNKENRKEGQVPRTQEIGSWSALLLVAAALPKLLGHELDTLRDLMTTSLSVTADADIDLALELLGARPVARPARPAAARRRVMVVGVAGAMAQGGFYLATKSVKPKFSKINPIAGLKRMFGIHALWEGAKMLLRSAVVAFLVWMAIKSMLPLRRRPGADASGPRRLRGRRARHDPQRRARRRRARGRRLRRHSGSRCGKQTMMSKDDVKQEHKQSEGDPLLKGAIRSRQLAMARNRMMADIPTADVVLVNPTHVAVALQVRRREGCSAGRGPRCRRHRPDDP